MFFFKGKFARILKSNKFVDLNLNFPFKNYYVL